jgi:hypothetical protein
MADKAADKDKSKVHKLSLKGSAKLVAEFVSFLHLPLNHARSTISPQFDSTRELTLSTSTVPVLDPYHSVRTGKHPSKSTELTRL